jgi:hypothetical protein
VESFSVAWRLRWWSDAGSRHDEQAVEVVEAPSDWHAQDHVRCRTIARVDWPRRPFRLAFDADRLDSTYHQATYPATIPHRHTLRRRVVGGTTPEGLRAELVAGGASLLHVLIGFAEAFEVPPEQALDDLDAIASRRHVWSRAFQIREAFVREASILETLQRLYHDGTCGNWIDLFQAMRDALGTQFSDTKGLIELACHRDPRFDSELTAAMKRRQR